MTEANYQAGEWPIKPSILQLSGKGKIKRLESQLMSVLILLG